MPILSIMRLNLRRSAVPDFVVPVTSDDRLRGAAGAYSLCLLSVFVLACPYSVFVADDVVS
jgi:hypothetical protein